MQFTFLEILTHLFLNLFVRKNTNKFFHFFKLFFCFLILYTFPIIVDYKQPPNNSREVINVHLLQELNKLHPNPLPPTIHCDIQLILVTHFKAQMVKKMVQKINKKCLQVLFLQKIDAHLHYSQIEDLLS